MSKSCFTGFSDLAYVGFGQFFVGFGQFKKAAIGCLKKPSLCAPVSSRARLPFLKYIKVLTAT